MITDDAVYLDGQLCPELRATGTDGNRKQPGTFAWLGVRDLDDDDLAQLEQAVGLDPALLSKAHRCLQRPGLAVQGETVVIAMVTGQFDPSDTSIDVVQVLLADKPLERLVLHEIDRQFRHIDNRVRARRELLDRVLDANLTQVGIRQNEDMRKISAWVATAAAPTLVAGIYGMNFEGMPELSWTYGYLAALALMITLAAMVHIVFRRKGWL
ncbi:CorA family divalent cation transporter [Nocardia brasiliensis]